MLVCLEGSSCSRLLGKEHFLFRSGSYHIPWKLACRSRRCVFFPLFWPLVSVLQKSSFALMLMWRLVCPFFLVKLQTKDLLLSDKNLNVVTCNSKLRVVIVTPSWLLEAEGRQNNFSDRPGFWEFLHPKRVREKGLPYGKAQIWRQIPWSCWLAGQWVRTQCLPSEFPNPDLQSANRRYAEYKPSLSVATEPWGWSSYRCQVEWLIRHLCSEKTRFGAEIS